MKINFSLLILTIFISCNSKKTNKYSSINFSKIENGLYISNIKITADEKIRDSNYVNYGEEVLISVEDIKGFEINDKRIFPDFNGYL